MAKFISTLLLSCSILCACTSNHDAATDTLTAEEKAKVERVTKLAEEYGWEFDSALTESQRIQEILKIDEDEFLKLAKHIQEVKQTEE